MSRDTQITPPHNYAIPASPHLTLTLALALTAFPLRLLVLRIIDISLILLKGWAMLINPGNLHLHLYQHHYH